MQVEAFTSVFWKCSGFGWKRDQDWFADEYLPDCLRPATKVAAGISDDACPSNPWEPKYPYRLTRFPLRWAEPASGTVITIPTHTPYIPLDHDWNSASEGRQPVWSDVLDQYPQLADGWTKEAIRQMVQFQCGTPRIIGGRLRVMPAPADEITVVATVRSTEMLLQQADEHAVAGRLLVLKDETKPRIIERARQYEVEQYGHPLAGDPRQPSQGGDAQPRLFDSLFGGSAVRSIAAESAAGYHRSRCALFSGCGRPAIRAVAAALKGRL